METKFRIAGRATCLLALVFAFAAVSPAQMGGGMMGGAPGGSATNGSTTFGGMMGGSGTGGYAGMMNSSLGGMMGGSLAGMMGGNSGLAIGPDGTLYVTRASTSQAQTAQASSTQLAAIDTNGNANWTLPITAGSASQPALGKDGTLFVTTSDWLSWMYSGSTPTTGTTANLLVVKPGATSASVVLTVSLQGQVASAPQIGTDNAGGYIVYVVTVDAFDGTSVNTNATSGTYLYAFSPAGTLKYRLQLSQGGFGMIGF